MNHRYGIKRGMAWCAAAAMLAGSLTGCGSDSNSANRQLGAQEAAFTPSLDTDAEISLDIAGFMGNFEALDQVVNNFNEYYPNVTITYNQNGPDLLREYLENNAFTDIFMTDETNVRYADWGDQYVGDLCLDLSQEDIDLSAVRDEMIEDCKIDGSLVRVPLAMNTYGIVVNRTLLENEGLKIPENFAQFEEVCEALKDKGYTPIQGSSNHLYAELFDNMTFNMIGHDTELAAELNDGNPQHLDKLRLVFERMDELIERGYTDREVNDTYPPDNYDEAILKFFEGDVPFWVCSAECVSGMKKRESKSEAFSAHPFEYQFMYAPVGDDGSFEYQQPWYGFSVNKDSDNLDYAVEFIRFLTTEDQLNTMANVKGMPSVAKQSEDERYDAIYNPQHVQESFLNDGTVHVGVTKNWNDIFNMFGSGQCDGVDGGMQAMTERLTW